VLDADDVAVVINVDDEEEVVASVTEDGVVNEDVDEGIEIIEEEGVGVLYITALVVGPVDEDVAIA